MHNLDLEKKRQYSLLSLLRAVVQNRNFDLSARNLTGKPINLGFPLCKTISKQEKKKTCKTISKQEKKNEKAATSKLVGVKCCEIYRSGL